VIATLASEVPDEQWRVYSRIFRELGVKKIAHLDFGRREDAIAQPRLDVLAGATAVFFCGGDQLKLTSKIAGTKTFDEIVRLYRSGATIAGTSAGAAALSETMLVGSPVVESHKVMGAFFTAAGMGLLREIIIDQHFGQRWRIGRLLGAVAEKPSVLGIGIDEDTAVLVDGSSGFEVIGSGAVYVIDGSAVTYTNISEHQLDRTMAIFNVRLHVLKSGNRFDLSKRQPSVVERTDTTAVTAEPREPGPLLSDF
jgi:cyanophycinase